MNIKTRFAPSPTGDLHIGNARTALYSWLFARKYGGEFILRIEDTDIERSTQQAINAIIDSMKWLKIDWDKGPYFQTNNLTRYQDIIHQLLKNGSAYKCYCSKQRLEELRINQIINGKKPRYDGYCRHVNQTNIKNQPYVVRFCNPQKGSVIFNDLIRGKIQFNNQELDDLIICRTEGMPTYNFCVTVDDFDMKITHVIRGEDHLNNTPRQINILQALGATIPKYAHLSMIMGHDGKKLSKRDSAVGVMQYRDEGFLPEALLNYLLRLGWSYGDQEIFSLDEMKRLFSLETINKSASSFDKQKLLWYNNFYIKKLPANYIAQYLLFHLKQMGVNLDVGPSILEIVTLFKTRCKTIKDMANNCLYFYKDFDHFDHEAAKIYLQPVAIKKLQTVRTKLVIQNNWTQSSVQNAILQTAHELEVNMEAISMPLRVAVTGTSQSPAIDRTIHAIGQSRSIKRIDMAIKYIFQNAQGL